VFDFSFWVVWRWPEKWFPVVVGGGAWWRVEEGDSDFWELCSPFDLII
jgi:hypothetical protein